VYVPHNVRGATTESQHDKYAMKAIAAPAAKGGRANKGDASKGSVADKGCASKGGTAAKGGGATKGGARKGSLEEKVGTAAKGGAAAKSNAETKGQATDPRDPSGTLAAEFAILDLLGKGVLTPSQVHAGLFAAGWEYDDVFGVFAKLDRGGRGMCERGRGRERARARARARASEREREREYTCIYRLRGQGRLPRLPYAAAGVGRQGPGCAGFVDQVALPAEGHGN
jgi:hypothetical protein